MYTNTSLGALASIKFGYHTIANQKSVKLRFKMDRATCIFNRLPAHFHRHISVFISMKGYVTIACITYHESMIWQALEYAVQQSKADCLRAEAQQIESRL